MADRFVYIDQNVVGDVQEGDYRLPVSSEFTWVYSTEHFNEIRRGNGDQRFLTVLRDLRARKVDLVLDDKFRLTGGAKIYEFEDPQVLYARHIETVDEVPFNDDLFIQPLARMLGADNYDSLSSLPDDFERELKTLLGSIGLLDAENTARVENAVEVSRILVSEHLKDRVELEAVRKGLGTHDGRAGNLARKDNPLEELWRILERRAPGVTADQFFGFDPIDKQGYDNWPLYFGIVSCYTALNFVGLRPDEGLSKVERMPAIVSDATHVAHAAYCHALLSRDLRLCDKARAIYRYKNIGTKVVHLSLKKEATQQDSK